MKQFSNPSLFHVYNKYIKINIFFIGTFISFKPSNYFIKVNCGVAHRNKIRKNTVLGGSMDE